MPQKARCVVLAVKVFFALATAEGFEGGVLNCSAGRWFFSKSGVRAWIELTGGTPVLLGGKRRGLDMKVPTGTSARREGDRQWGQSHIFTYFWVLRF